MSDSYHSRPTSYGTGSVILFILGMMVGVLGYLVAFGETFRPSPMSRVYLADMPDLYDKPLPEG